MSVRSGGRILTALVVGGGSIGRRHLSNLRRLEPSAEIVLWRQHAKPGDAGAVVSDADRVVYSLADALDTHPDLAVVASPATRHVETGLALASNDVPLLVEKPLSHRQDEARALITLCRERALALMVGYNLRFYPPLQTLRETLVAGEIGRPMSIRADVGQHLPEWRPGADYRSGVSARSDLGGGVLLELSHELDYVSWLVGGVRSVMALVGHLSDLEIDVEDTAEILLRFQGGAFGSIHLDMTQAAMTRSCRLVGTEGVLVWNGLDHSVRLYRAAARSWSDLCAPCVLDRNEMFLSEMRHFLHCVRNGARPAVTGEDGLRALDIAVAAKESACTLKAVDVSVAEGPPQEAVSEFL